MSRFLTDHALPVMRSLPRPLLFTLCICVTLVACKSDREKAATVAAQTWLSLIDAGSYAQSWTVSAPYLQRVAAETNWEASMNRVRNPLGRVLSRKTRSAKATLTALNDQCVIVEFDTAFENKRSAIETVTVMPQKDGQWKIAGYFIK